MTVVFNNVEFQETIWLPESTGTVMEFEKLKQEISELTELVKDTELKQLCQLCWSKLISIDWRKPELLDLHLDGPV